MIKKFEEFLEEGILTDHKNMMSELHAGLEKNERYRLMDIFRPMSEAGVIFALQVYYTGGNPRDNERYLFNKPDNSDGKSLDFLDEFTKCSNIMKSKSELVIPSMKSIDNVANRIKDVNVLALNKEVSKWFEKEFKDLQEKDRKVSDSWTHVKFATLLKLDVMDKITKELL